MGQMTMAQWYDGIQNGLTKQLVDHQKSLPKGFNKDRFILNCITMIKDMTKDEKSRQKLEKVTPTSIITCFMKGAVLGLDFFNKECYAIPYGTEMQFQTDYKGEIKLNKKYSKNQIRDIFAKVVREGDEFYEEVDSGEQKIYFKPKQFNNGKLIGAFAVVKYIDGSMQYETMSAEEIENVRRAYSKAADSKAWKESTGEMYKKTVLRRLCKFVDLDFDNIDQIRAFEDGGDADFSKTNVIQEQHPVNVFDAPAAEVIPQIEQRPEPARPEHFRKQEAVPVQRQEAAPVNQGFMDGGYQPEPDYYQPPFPEDEGLPFK